VTRACASPDRLDALVYAVTELLAPPRAEPRIRSLWDPLAVPYWAKPLYE
jgi:hypothetical protein